MINLDQREFRTSPCWADGCSIPSSCEYLTALGSPSTQEIVLVNASEVTWLTTQRADRLVERSVTGMLDSSLVQDGTAGTGASLVSLWQSNLLGLRAEREITWKKRRTAAAAYLSPVAYTPS